MGTSTFPRMFGKYALLRAFARGGMGEICLAALGELGGLEKLCLVKKVIEADDQPSLAARLLDEAKVAVRLNHANLVQVFDAGKVDEELYIAMELIEGRDLRAVWNRTAERRSRIPLDVALYIVREMARGLEYAHNYGGLNLVHRDIAPPNILLSWHGEVKITDFGLARSILKSEKTAPGIVYGRIAYLAPEQARGEQADKRTDLYAVGVILWELLTGRPLHETTEEAVKNLEMARHPRVEPPSHLARGIAPTLDAVVMRALSPKREERFQNAEELRRGLSEELARVAPTTDASRLAGWLSELFEEEVKGEAIEHERMLREDLPRLRARSTFQVQAMPRDNTPKNVVRAQSLDLRIAGVDRESDAVPETPPRGQPQLPGVRGRPNVAPASAQLTVARPEPRSVARPAPAFDDDGETRVQESRARSTQRGAAQAAPRPEPSEELEPETLVGEVIDARYRIERLLGTGGMGAVYEAEHIEIGKKVALKVLHPQFSRQADLVARFRREARAASKVGHPNIVDVTDSGTTENGDAYFVMERLDGTDLADVLRHERRLAVERTVAIGTQICRALHAAHQAGIIHRDLKPENIFLVARDGQPDFVKVLDFGIAKSDAVALAAQPRRLTTPGIAMGTPEYMAPEQAAGKPVDGRVDIYSVGAILYEMLVGEPPHAGSSVMDILAKKATEPPAPIRTRNKSVPETLQRVVMGALEKDPAARPQTMAALEYELNKCMKGRGSAVAAVLGLKPVEDTSWNDETNRSGVFDNGHYSRPNSVSRGNEGFSPTMPGIAGSQELATRTGMPQLPDESAPAAATPAPPKPSGLTRVLGILSGLAFLGAGGYFAYSYQARTKPTLTLPTNPNKPTPSTTPVPTVTPTVDHTTPPTDPVVPTPAPTVPQDEVLSAQQIADRLEWAQRAYEGGRIVSPPGDNLKELLDKIEKASPGNPRAADLRNKACAALERRGILAHKKQRFEEAEDAFRALVVLRPDDDKAKERLARTLTMRADQSLDKRRYTAAVADANQALELTPDDVLARMVLAEAHLATGKREVAAEEFRRVLELRPTNARARKGLALSMAPTPLKHNAKGGGKKTR